MSFFDIARYLNSLGLKTSHGKPFERRSVEYIIQNPSYCGMIRWNRTENSTNRIKDKDEWIVTEGQQPAIISKELFESAQERFKATYKPIGKRPSSTYKHWLSGLLKCPDCGKEIPVFGKSKVDAAAKELGLAVGGKLPIDPSLTELSDAGAFANARNPYLEAAVCALRVLDVKHETQE